MNSNKLKEFCRSIGLRCVGIAGIGPYEDLKIKIDKRISDGYITGMEEPIIENRINPRNTMENVKSIIVCAFPYYNGDKEKSNISKYCKGKDYHIVVREILQIICDYLSDKIPGFEYKHFADTGPLVDRYLAYLSGIGYFGINNNIITDEYGSYVFIGYIMNNYEFTPDKPLQKSCIKCMKCVKYCPGNALLGDYNMNPKKCLSYITQKKEEFTEDEIYLLKKEKKVFGCDICQDVCPHNKDIPITHIDDFKNDIINNLSYDEINSISNKEFKRRYGNRAFSWRGKNIIKRNMDIIYEDLDR